MIVYQKPLVSRGDKFKKGHLLCDAHAVDN
jgi:hypothetical protein